MKKRLWVLMLLLLLSINGVLAQAPLPPAEADADAFLETNFLLQDTYARVLCASQNNACPAEVTATVPCLTTACQRHAATYPITETYATIQAAVEVAQAGDLIIITPGRYRGVEIENTGGAGGAYIHLLGWGDPGSIIIDSPADPDKNYLRHHFYFINAHHYIIQNLAFEGAENGAGIFFSGFFSYSGTFAHHVIVMDTYSHDNYKWGLHTTATSYVLIQDSVFAGSEDEHGVYISGSGDHMIIRRNVFQGNNASGLQVNADPQVAALELFYWLGNTTGDTCGLSEDDVDGGTAIWADVKDCYDGQGLPDLGMFIEDGISEQLIIEQNVMMGNGAGGAAGINLASVRHTIVRNNLVYGNGAAGIACWDNNYAEDKGLPSSEFGCLDVTIVNNTIVDESGGRGALILNQDARDMTVFNNIIIRDRFDAYEITGRSGQGLRSGANYYSAQVVDVSPGAILLDNDAASGSLTSFSVNDGLANFVAPGFELWVLLDGPWPTLNPARPDYHPVASSILIHMGNPDYSPTLDIMGTLRNGTTVGVYAASE